MLKLIDNDTIKKRYRRVEQLEDYLGNPFDGTSRISYKKILSYDESEEFPQELLNIIHDFDFQHYYIPHYLGGKLKSFEEFQMMGRILSRRDLSLTITDAHTLLGSLPVWINGTHAQQQFLAHNIKNRKTACLAISEKEHGSDLLSTSVIAEPSENGFIVEGEKWPINKATMTDMICFIARTEDTGDARGMSMFLFDKGQTDRNSYTHLSKIKTLGIKACDISGIKFNACRINENAMIGKKGQGIETALKGFHITRTLCASLSLGALDTALRSTLRFALERRLYNETLLNIPHAKNTLAKAYVDILIADCMAVSSSRAIHVVAQQFSIWSAIVKYFVPTLTEKIFHQLSVILGARFYLREEHDYGIFQKMLRDNSIISLFDGSSIVNLNAIGLQFKHLSRKRKQISEKRLHQVRKNLERIFALEQDLPDFDFGKLDLFSKGNNEVIDGIEIAREKLINLKHEQTLEPVLIDNCIAMIDKISELLDHLDQKVEKYSQNQGNYLSPEIFDVAKEYCVIHAAMSCIYMWIYNRNALTEFFSKGQWLLCCLQRLLHNHIELEDNSIRAYEDVIINQMLRTYHGNLLFSVIPVQIKN